MSDLGSPERTASGGAQTESPTRRQIVAIAIGNLLEWYDFAIYASLASVLGQLFFPSQSGFVSILSTFSVLAVGYVARPVGAAIFGRLSDKYGRKLTMVVVVAVMGCATVLIGVLPTYAAVGLLAPVLLVIARIAQGLSVGGEFSASAAFLVEVAPSGRRGVYGSVAYLTAVLGFAMGLGVVVLINLVLPAGSLAGGAWRIPFLLGLPILLVGAYLRRKVQESPEFSAVVRAGAAESAPLAATFRREWKPMLQMLGLGASFGMAVQTVLAFVLTYLLVIRHESPGIAYNTTLIAIVLGALACPFFGALSDRVGRKPLLMAGCVLQIVLAFPGYLLLATGGFGPVLVGQLLLWLPVAVFCGVSPAAYSEMYPSNLRSSGMGMSYAVAGALFGGTAPLIATLLIAQTGSVTSPAWMLVAGAVISAMVIISLKETAHAQLRVT